MVLKPSADHHDGEDANTSDQRKNRLAVVFSRSFKIETRLLENRLDRKRVPFGPP
jgi:hypothetical protein